MEDRAYGVLGGKIGRIKRSNVDPAWLAGELLAAKIIGVADFQRASNSREEEDERLGRLVGKVIRNGAPDVFQNFVSILLKEDHVKWLGEELKDDFINAGGVWRKEPTPQLQSGPPVEHHNQHLAQEAPGRLKQAFLKVLDSFKRHAECEETEALGHGSFGSVYKFLMEKDVVVAGKVYRLPPPENIEKYVRSFCTMFTMLHKLQHDNIVSFYGVTFVDGNDFPVLLMERCECNLEGFLRLCPEDQKKTISTKLHILRGAVNGLNFLHNQKIVHRDLTARNVLLDKHNTAKIADFGQAKLISHNAVSVTMTPMLRSAIHLPPEASQSTYDEKIDIFSFGHLCIFTITQEAIEFLPPHVKDDSETGNPVYVSEVERRQAHISHAASTVGENHFVITMLKSCLHYSPKKRPCASDLLKKFPEEEIGPHNLIEVNKYLRCLNRDQLKTLGLVLGLHCDTLQNYDQATNTEYLHQLLRAWLRKQDDVMGNYPPTWTNMVKALEDDQIRQNGIADRIKKDRGL